MKKMRYLDTEGVWLLPPPEGESFEIIVSGDRSGPDAGRVAILKKAMEAMDEIRARATAHLEAFVERSKFADGSDWYFEGVESGRAASEHEAHFSLYFSIEGDIYGEWSVSFEESDSRFYPVSFMRREI
jgi:hypothetical protein